MGTFRKVAKTTDLEPGTATLVEIDGEKIAPFNVGGEFCAIDNTCTHRGGPLDEGVIEGDVVTCPWHRATYNVKTGEVLGPPAPKGVASYNVRVEGSDIEIEVPQ